MAGTTNLMFSYGIIASGGSYYTDIFGVPYAPVSVRKLSPNSVYSGPCLRVRRSSDNTEQDINFVSSSPDALLDTAALATFVGANSAFVVKWYFQNGSGLFFEQTTAANQPRIVNSGVIDTRNSIPCLVFDGSNDYMEVASSSGLTMSPTTFYAVASRGNSTAALRTILSTGILAGERGYGLFYGGAFGFTQDDLFNQTRYTTGGTAAIGDYSNLQDTISMISSVTTNTQDKIWFNGGSPFSATFTETNTTTTTNLSIGTRLSGGGSFYLNGSLQEVIIYQSDKSSVHKTLATNVKDVFDIPTYFIDEFSTLALAYSMRKLSLTASNCMRVRRSSDNVENNFGFDTSAPDSPFDTTTLLSTIGSNNGLVVDWFDQSQTGTKLTNATAGNQPRIVNSGSLETSGSLPAISGAAGSVGLGTASTLSISGSSDLWLFLTIDVTDASSTQVIYEGSTNYNSNSGAIIAYINSNVLNIGQKTPTGPGYCLVDVPITTGRKLITIRLRPGQTAANFAQVWINGASQTINQQIAGDSTTFSNNTLYVGARNNSSLTFTGKIQEFLVYTTDQSSDRVTIQDNINDYYNIY